MREGISAVVAVIKQEDMILVGRKRTASNHVLDGAWHIAAEEARAESDLEELGFVPRRSVRDTCAPKAVAIWPREITE